MADYYLKIESIPGESAAVRDAIEVLSYSWGVSNSSSASMGGGLSGGRASSQGFRFVAPTTTASAALFVAVMSGATLPSAVLTMATAGADGKNVPKFIWTMSKVRVTEYFCGGPGDVDGDGSPDVDTFSLDWEKIKLELGSASNSKVQVAGWDLKANKKV